MPFPDIQPQDPVIVQSDIDWEVTVDDINWTEDDMLDLPGELQSVVVNENEAEQRIDFFVKFPPGYVDPRHTHAAAHADLIVQWEMHVHGEILTPGDYITGRRSLTVR